MRSLIAGLILLFAGEAWGTDDHRVGQVPDVLAQVNADVITVADRNRVRTDLLAATDASTTRAAGVPRADVLDRLALESLIDRRLLLQEAQRLELTVSRQELDAAVTELRSRFDDLVDFGAWMNERGLDDASLFETVADDILLRRVTAALVDGATVTESEVRAYFSEHGDELVMSREVRLAIIAVNSANEAEMILQALRDGFDFRELARQYSLGRLAPRGGDTGWIDFRSLPPTLLEVVASLRTGEASRPLQNDDGEYLVVALAGSRPVIAASLDEARTEIERRLLEVEKRKALAGWLSQRRKESSIEIFAREY